MSLPHAPKAFRYRGHLRHLRHLRMPPYVALAASLALALLVAWLLLAASPSRPAFAPVVAGQAAPGQIFLDGLYGPEQAPDGSGYRWTGGSALIQLRGAFFAAPAYRVELRLRADNPAGPQPLTLLANGAPAAVVTPDTRFRTYALLLAPNEAAGHELWLALQTPTFVAPGNPRPLGVILTDARLTPVARPDLGAASLAALGLLALWAALRVAGAPPRHALALVGLAALGVVGAALLYKPAALPLPWLIALVLLGVAGAALVAHTPRHTQHSHDEAARTTDHGLRTTDYGLPPACTVSERWHTSPHPRRSRSASRLALSGFPLSRPSAEGAQERARGPGCEGALTSRSSTPTDYGLPTTLSLAALAVLVALSGLIWPPWLSDDAFISFRYAQNLAAGNGLVYNVGERVEGYTNFLWTVLAAGVIALGGDVALWSHLSGVALGLAVLLLSYRMAARLIGPAWALVAALIVGTSQSLLLYTARGSGLETGLFTLLALAASERYLAADGARRGPLVAAGLLLGLAALTRPEGALLFALTAAHLVLQHWWRPRSPALPLSRSPGLSVLPSPGLPVSRSPGLPVSRFPALPLSLLPLAGAFLIIFLPHFLWRVSYYGDLLPNTFYAKTGGGLSQLLRGLQYAGGFALTLGGPLLLLIFLPWWRDWRAALASWRSYLLLLVLVYSAYIVAVGGDHFYGERFFVPLLPWFAILLADGLAAAWTHVTSRSPGPPVPPSPRPPVPPSPRPPVPPSPRPPVPPSSSPASPRPLLRLFLALLLAGGAGAALTRTNHLSATIQGLDESVWIWREIGWWMADHAPPGASLAAAGAGAPAFFGQRETIDLFGLTDRHIGRLEIAGMGEGVAGHEKRDPAYVLDTRRVTYIPRIWDDYFGGAPALQDRYRLMTVSTRTGRAIQLWERLPSNE